MVGEHTDAVRRRFPPRPDSVREARRMIRDCLAAHDREDLVDTAELLVSEIVTNALVHAGTPIEVAFSFPGGGLRVEVTDGSPHAPTPRGYGPSAGTGRGLRLLQDMVDDWGVTPAGPGKTVWFQIASHAETELSDAPAGRRPAASGVAGSVPPAGTVAVELLDVPLLLHEAWRQHAESLLREHLLASLDLGPDPSQAGVDPIDVHAQASDAIALLAEQVPPSGISEDPDEVMVDATDPRITASTVDLSVPRASVGHFATLDRTIEEALVMVEAGVFLTPSTQPEVQALRAWLCGEVVRQARGESPTRWSPLRKVPVRVPHPVRWDTGRVSRAPTAVLAADDADRIVAASQAAVDLLGYREEEDLVGGRLISVIPERYRQAHLAGFTMHFLSGRSPLVGKSVVVPALRADGREIEVSLTIRTERTDDGRTVFVADLLAL